MFEMFRGGRRWLKSDVDRFQERWDALKDVSAKKALVTEYLEKAKLIAEVSWNEMQPPFPRCVLTETRSSEDYATTSNLERRTEREAIS